jgi:hypothetical protein
MKIGISCHHIFGGSRAMATELGKALAMKGYTVHFFSQAALFRLGLYSRNIHCHEIVAHVAVCCMALVCIRHVTYRVQLRRSRRK